MKAEFPYQRVGPRVRNLLGCDTLWLGEEHLLAVHNRRFVEEYRRFELREIQAITLCKQARFTLPVYWLLACAVVFAAAITGTVLVKGVFAEAGWTALIMLGIYWLAVSIFGSCKCSLQTAVGVYELSGLYRYAPAKRALHILEAKISEIQGALPEDWTSEDTLELAQTAGSEGVTETGATKGSGPVWLGTLACAALLLDALLSWLVRTPNASAIVHALNMPATLLAVLLPMVSIVVSRRDKRFQHLRTLFLIAVVAVGLANYGNSVATSVIVTLQRAGMQPPVTGADSFFYWMNQIAEVALGSLGLLHLWGDRGHSSAP